MVRMAPIHFPDHMTSHTWSSVEYSRRMAWSCTRSCHRQFTFTFHYLVTILLDRVQDLDLTIYISDVSPFILLWLPLLDRAWDLDLLIYISDVSSLSGQSLLMILLFIVLSYSNPSTYCNLGTFLVCPPIVLSLRKVPIGPVYKPAHESLCPLASSTHKLHSNLVSSLGLPLVSVPANFWRQCGWPPRAATLLWQPLYLSLTKDSLLLRSTLLEEVSLDTH